MKYMVGFLIRGELAEYMKATCADLTARFGVTDVSEIVAPRLTIKAPFERSTPENIERILSECTASIVPEKLSFTGWNSFGTRTIFIDAPEVPANLKAGITNFLEKVRASGVMTSPQEFDMKLHLSVARFLQPNQFQLITAYLKTVPAPKFEVLFDNLTLFTKERDARNWKVLKTFPLMGIK